MNASLRRAPSAANLLHLLHRAGQCADELFAANIGQSDITPRQFTVLAAAAAGDDLSQTSLVELTGIDRSTIADIVRRLVERGLIQRRRTKRDARMYAIRLTAHGKAALDTAAPAASQTDAQLTQMLNPAQRLQLLGALQQIVDTLGPISSAGGAGKSATDALPPPRRLIKAAG